MDVTVAKKDLLRFVARAQAIADKKSTMPILSNVLLEAGKTGLTVSATDLYLSVSGEINAEVRRPGSVAVPARDLHDRIKAMPDGPLHLSSEANGNTVLKAPGTARRYTLHSVPGSEFPKLPQPAAGAPRLAMPADLLATLIARTQFSISPDDTRPNLNSALFEWQNGRVRMVTTDGHRLSKMEVAYGDESASATLLLPLKAVVELRRLADEARAAGAAKDAEGGKADGSPSAGEVTLTPSGPNAFFEVAGATFGVKLVDAQFPSYQQVIPQQSERTAKVGRMGLAESLRAVSLAASDRTGGVKLTLTPGLLRITSESPESGDGLDELPMEYDGKEITVGFNAKYFLDVLSAIDDEEEVVLGLSGELDPAVLRPATESAERQYIAVVMPMRI
jgi:DNA polymerase-3 subunit beta